jgi:hypothetical protein
MPQNLLNLYFILITKTNHFELSICDEIQNYNGSKLLTSSNLISSNTQKFEDTHHTHSLRKEGYQY